MRGFAACARCGVPLPVYGPELCAACTAATQPARVVVRRQERVVMRPQERRRG